MKHTWLNKRRLIILGIIGLIPIFVVAMVFTCAFLTAFHTHMHERCRYVENMEHFKFELLDYLTDYYREHGHYPENLDISQFPIYQNAKYQRILDKIHYSSDGNCFELHWKRPASLKQEPDRFVVIINKACDGKEATVTVKSLP